MGLASRRSQRRQLLEGFDMHDGGSYTTQGRGILTATQPRIARVPPGLPVLTAGQRCRLTAAPKALRWLVKPSSKARAQRGRPPAGREAAGANGY